jgi:DNA-binding NarL/FixJ family response regulator
MRRATALVVDKPELAGAELPRVAPREARVRRVAEGIEIAGAVQPDVIVLHGLRGERGVEVVRAFRERAASSTVVAFLGDYDERIARRMIAAGADACVERRSLRDLVSLTLAAVRLARRRRRSIVARLH